MNHKTPMVKLGDLIEECNERNSDCSFKAEEVVGINISKQFISTVANLQSTDISKYSIVPNDHFACNLMHVGRDVRIPIAYNEDKEPKIVSPAYFVFCIKKDAKTIVKPEYLSLIFSRYEFDRLCWFYTDSSIRGNLPIGRFCEIEIPLPSIGVQQSLVAIYDGLQKIISENETLIRQLESVCHDFVVDCKYKYPKVILGDWIEECDERNNDNALTLDNVRGISIQKKFIPTKADMEGVSLTPYKIVKKNWFACVPVTSRNGEKITLALYDESIPAIVSSSYYVFRSKDENTLLPEYLFLFFKRAEFDRYARFNSWGSARETFDFSEMCRVAIPLPPIEIQRSIATVTHSLQEARRIVQDAKDLIKTICPALVQKAAHSA